MGAAPDATVWSAGGDGTIKQWSASTMGMLRTLPLAQTNGAAFASSGQQAILVNSAGVQVANLTDGSIVRTFSLGNYGAGAYFPAISADGQTYAFARSTWTADYLVFAAGQGPERIFKGTNGFGTLNAIAVSADGQYVASVFNTSSADPKNIRLFRVSDGTQIRTLTYSVAPVTALAFSPDGTLLASSSTDGKINIVRLSDLVVISSIGVYENGKAMTGNALAFSTDDTMIAEGDSVAAHIFHVPDGTSLARIAGNTFAVNFTPDSQWLAVGTSQNVRLWLVATSSPLPTIAPPFGTVTAVAYSPKGDLVASASTDLTIKLRRASDGSLVANLTGHTGVVNSLAFSPDGDMLATASSDMTIRIWRTSDFSLVTTLTGHTQAVLTVTFSPDGSLLASGSALPEQAVKLWSVQGQWSNVGTYTGAGGNVTSVQFSPDGQTLAGASDAGIVRLWQVSSGALLRTYLAPSNGVMSLAFSPDGQLLVAGWLQDILVFQGPESAPIITIPAHAKNGTVVAFSPDGQQVLSGNADGTLKLWSPASWSLITQYNQETDAVGLGVTAVGYSPDNTRFVYGRADATIGVATTGATALPATVTVTTTPSGLAVSVDGASYTAPHTFSWTPGSSHSIGVKSPQGSTGAFQVFQTWSDGGAQTHTVMPASSRIYAATFTTFYQLTLQSQPPAGGSISASPPSQKGYYAAGQQVQLTAIPASGYLFSSWSVDLSGTSNPTSISMTQPHNVTAIFSTVLMADIAVSMVSSASQINSGKPLSYSVTVTNLGPATSDNPTLIDNLPSALSFVSATASQGHCSGTVQISCPLGTLASGASATVTINVTPIATGLISNSAAVDPGQSDPNPGNNSATVTVTVLPAGMPPILWMGGDSVAYTIVPTSDGVTWTANSKELMRWRTSDMQLIQTLAPDVSFTNGAPVFAVTSDGQYFSYASASAVAVYRASDGSSVRQFGGGYSPSISDDGQTLAFCGGFYGPVVIGNVATGSTINISNGCGLVAISPDGQWLAVLNPGADQSDVRIYRTSDGSYVRSFSGQAAFPDRLMWAADSNLLMTASSTDLKVWRLSDFLQLQSIAVPTGGAEYHSAAISRDGQFVAFGAGDYGNGVGGGPAAFVWRVDDGSLVTTVNSNDPPSGVPAVNFTLDDQWLIVSQSWYLRNFSLPQGALSPNLTSNVGTDGTVAYSSAGNLIATGGGDYKFTVWDSSTGKVLASVTSAKTSTSDGSNISLAFSQDGELIAAGVDNNISVYNTAGYNLVTTLTGHTQPVVAVAFSPDGTLVASGSASPEQTVKLWSTQSWSLVRTLTGASGGIRSIRFSPDGKTVVAGADDGIARAWNVTTGALITSYICPTAGAMRIDYSPDGTKIAAGWTSKVLIFDTGNSLPVQTLNAHTQNNTSVAWSPDGTRLISANPDGTVDVWDTSTWGQLAQYNQETYAQSGGVLAVAYSPDNSQFAYGRADATLVVVDSGSPATGTIATITTNPAGLIIVVDGATMTSPQTFRWAAGTTHTIGVPSQQGSGGTRNTFASWSDGGAETHTITVPATSATYTAVFATQYLLTLGVSPTEAGSVIVTPESPDGYYDSGTIVQLVATPDSGYLFQTWSGDVTSSSNPLSITMNSPTSITATYSTVFTTTVTTSPPGLDVSVDGTLYTAPQSFDWTVGTTHIISVTSPQGTHTARYVFSAWSDGGAQSHSITAAASTTYTASFTLQYPLTMLVKPGGSGTVSASPTSSDGYYNAGTSVRLTAAPAGGYQFTVWSGGLTGSANPQSVVMNSLLSVTANFVTAGCTYNLDPGSASFGANGGTGSVSVTAGTGCNWSAASNASWLTINSGIIGSGNGTVKYTAAANTGSGRSGTLVIAGITFTVTQAGAALKSLTLNPSTLKGGSTAIGTVTLRQAAPAGGASVALASSNPAVAAVPSGVSVPAGQTSTTFSVTTTAVSVSTNVTISATYQKVTKGATLTVNP